MRNAQAAYPTTGPFRVQRTRKERAEARDEIRSVRARTIAAIHLTWKKLRRDLHDPAESREQRLTFMAGVLKKQSLGSSRDLTDKQLGKVLDAMRDLENAPELPGVAVIHEQRAKSEGQSGLLAPGALPSAEIYHLATAAQVSAIDKLLTHLGWGREAKEGFLFKRFKRKSPELLSPKQANSLTMILLTIAASNAVRSRGVQRASRLMIREEIPRLKAQLGIDTGTRRRGDTGNEVEGEWD
jgi:hypothetical protein